MKILLTGGTGFVGRNLEIQLKTVYGYDVSSFGSQSWNLMHKEACAKMISVVKPDVIVHAAGSVGGIGANRDNPGKFIYENLVMGANMIHQAMINKVDKFILLGTVCSYPKFTEVPFKEEDLWLGYPEETNAPYGIAKKTLGEMLIAYKKQYGMNGAYLLPCNMYGPHDHFNYTTSHVIPALILKFYAAKVNNDKEVTVWGTGEPSREFLYVKDLADAVHLSIEKETDSTPINIGTGKETKIIDLVETIANKIGYNGTIFFDTTKPDGQPRRCLSTEKAKRVLGFEAKTDLDTGLDETIDYFLYRKRA